MTKVQRFVGAFIVPLLAHCSQQNPDVKRPIKKANILAQANPEATPSKDSAAEKANAKAGDAGADNEPVIGNQLYKDPESPGETPAEMPTPEAPPYTDPEAPPYADETPPSPYPSPVPPVVVYEPDRVYTERYVQVSDLPGGDHYSVKCQPKEFVAGVRYKDVDDDHVTGLYCGSYSDSINYVRERLIAVPNRRGHEYAVLCNSDEYLGGVTYDNDGDDHVTGIYCRSNLLDTFAAPTSFKTEGLGGHIYDVMCAIGDVITGFGYDDKGDDNVTAMFCSRHSSQP
jgi:hypothetical protein